MGRTWLILDCNNLAWKSYYALPYLSSTKDVPTGILFGFFRDLINFAEVLHTKDFVFCFDYGPSLREKDCPGYKGTRKKKIETDPKLKKAYSIVRSQVDLLRYKYLPKIGYQNIFFQEGYEADDLIASVCYTGLDQDTAIIVSSDTDLYQLLSYQVAIYLSGERNLYTHNDFFDDWGMSPTVWIDAKAMAGCGTDDVKGIKGVGLITAMKYWKGELKEGSAKHRLIVNGWKRYERNLSLVELPYRGTKRCLCRPDLEVTEKSWNKVMRSLDMNSLLYQLPGGGRRSRAV